MPFLHLGIKMRDLVSVCQCTKSHGMEAEPQMTRVPPVFPVHEPPKPGNCNSFLLIIWCPQRRSKMSALSPRDCVELDLAKERNKRLAYINGDIPVSFEHASFLQKSNLGGNSLAANLPSTSLLHGPPISWPSHYQNNLGRLNFDIPHHYSNPSQVCTLFPHVVKE